MAQTYSKSRADHCREWERAQRERVARIIGGLPALDEPAPTRPDPAKVSEDWRERLARRRAERRRARAELEAPPSVYDVLYNDTPY